MSSSQALQMHLGSVGVGPLLEMPQWYASRTRARHERLLAEQLEKARRRKLFFPC